MAKIAVIGAGKWGSALAYALAKEHEVVISSQHTRKRQDFVSMQEALSYEYIVITVPAQFVRAFLQTNNISSTQKFLVAAKGIESNSGAFLNEIYSSFIEQNNLAFLSGPSFAVEVMQEKPTALVVSSYNIELAKTFSSFFPGFIRTYCDDDVIGAEVAGAYKNVIAIASGICSGLNLGQNATAALISRGLVEMVRFAKHFGAKEQTFLGLSGAGDLFLTASSTTSRNYRVGLGLAQQKSQEQIAIELNEVAEGIGTTYALQHIAKKYEIYLPIASEVFAILEGKDPIASMHDLLER